MKNPHSRLLFSNIFKEKQWPGGYAILAPRLYNSYNHSHAPGQHVCQSQGPGPDSKCSKTVAVAAFRSDIHVLKPCQREIATDEIQERKHYSTNILSEKMERDRRELSDRNHAMMQKNQGSSTITVLKKQQSPSRKMTMTKLDLTSVPSSKTRPRTALLRRNFT